MSERGVVDGTPIWHEEEEVMTCLRLLPVGRLTYRR